MTEQITKDVFRGIHYIRLSQLPEDQKIAMENWLKNDMVIKIMIDKEILPDCVQYRHYEEWYNEVFMHLVDSEAASSEANAVYSKVFSEDKTPSS